MKERFTYFDVACMNGSFFLMGSGLYWQGITVFIIGGLTSGFVNSIIKREVK